MKYTGVGFVVRINQDILRHELTMAMQQQKVFKLKGVVRLRAFYRIQPSASSFRESRVEKWGEDVFLAERGIPNLDVYACSGLTVLRSDPYLDKHMVNSTAGLRRLFGFLYWFRKSKYGRYV